MLYSLIPSLHVGFITGSKANPHETINIFCFSAFLQVSEGIDHLKMEILSSSTRPCAILMSDFLLWSTKDDVIRMFKQILQLKWMGMDMSSKNGRKAPLN